jgi:hypothetical protein
MQVFIALLLLLFAGEFVIGLNNNIRLTQGVRVNCSDIREDRIYSFHWLTEGPSKHYALNLVDDGL